MLQKVRENDNYMKLSRMGSRYPSRLSFSRSMLRRLINDNAHEAGLTAIHATLGVLGAVFY